MSFNLLNFKPVQQPPKGLLGPYYDPAEERRQKIFGAMSAAGAALLQGGQGNFGQVIGQGLAGANQGMQQAGQNYRNDAMLYSQMEQQQQDRERQIGMENTKMGWTLEDRAKADAQAAQAEKLKTNQTNAIMDWAHSKSPEFQAWAQNFPEEAAKVYATEMAPTSGTKPTDDMAEYDKALSQGYKGTFLEYLTEIKKAGAQNITIGGGKYGTIPPGYELVETPQGAQLRAIPGGPPAIEAATLAEKAASQKATEAGSGDIVLTDISRALDKMQKSTLPTTGLMGNLTKDVPGFAAHDVNKLLETISGNIGFDRLQQMRNDSPTGGALGAINKTEMDLLQAVKGNLAQSQSQEQLEYNLKRLNNIYLDIIHGANAGPPRMPLGSGPLGSDLKRKYGLE